VTIAAGTWSSSRREIGDARPELDVALEELQRIDRIVDHLLLLATADQPDFLSREQIDLEAFLEDVFMRWSEVAPRSWRLAAGCRHALGRSPALAAALDALLENAVKYTELHAAIELRSRVGHHGEIVIEVRDEGSGVPSSALERIFDRFARADAARTRSAGGVGWAWRSSTRSPRARRALHRDDPGKGSTFALWLPRFAAAPASPSVAQTAAVLLRGRRSSPVAEGTGSGTTAAAPWRRTPRDA